MTFYKVLAMYKNHCGGESFSFVIQADDEIQAREKARENIARLEYNFYGADRYDYDVEELPDSDVVLIEHDEWG